MKVKKNCDVCGREFEYPFYAYLWEDVICFDCVWACEAEQNLQDYVILPSGGAEHGQ